MEKLVIIAGPTASGKTALAVELARLFDCEVISADSMQVYRHMDIGTAKPAEDEVAGVAHHLISVVDPSEEYTAARFREDALRKIREINGRGKRAVIAGGTGLYIKALTQGLFEGPEADRELRRGLLEEAEKKGRAALHEKLREVDPVSASRIHPNNLHRVVRALEVYSLSKRPISEFQQEHSFAQAPFETLKIGLSMEREELYAAIDRRVEMMAEAGLLEETRRLLSMGYHSGLKPMRGLGYKEMTAFIEGEYGLDEAVRLIKRNTRHYAKRQMTWFRKDPEIRWFKPGDKTCIIGLVRGFLD
ncbi:tRNA (adenosine(37)-N6)-dimethylallyltransferase MiaA [bacterium]|nr:tRNA (adenosine(37)-N6)-dimethylallyltransferase MiaA [bacterium]